MPVKKIVTIDTFKTSIQGVYPFRVRFQNLSYPGFSSNTVAPIGLAVIGSTFLIL